jgi:hypothetical protein
MLSNLWPNEKGIYLYTVEVAVDLMYLDTTNTLIALQIINQLDTMANRDLLRYTHLGIKMRYL